MIKIRHVQQISDKTCGHACLSMVTGIPIDELVARFGDLPLGDAEEAVVLTEMGILPVPIIALGGFPGLTHAGAYFISVPSINRPGQAHRIVARAEPGWRIFDPQYGREGVNSYGPNAFDDVDGCIKHWSEAVFLHSMDAHKGTAERMDRYAARRHAAQVSREEAAEKITGEGVSA